MADDLILSGPSLPFKMPEITIGQLLFSKLISNDHDVVLMREVETERSVTTGEFLQMSIKVAKKLMGMNLESQDIVCLLGQSGIDLYVTSTGVLFSNATVAPLDPNLSPDLLRSLVKIMQPKFVFIDEDISEMLEEILQDVQSPPKVFLYNTGSGHSDRAFEELLEGDVDVATFQPTPSRNLQESVAFTVCSSGTMGTPKAIMITDRNIIFQVTLWCMKCKMNKIPTCTAISFSNFFWISGLLMYVSSLSLNHEMLIVCKIEANHILRAVEKYKPSWGMFGPALVKYLTEHEDVRNYNVSSLVLFLTGGCCMQKEVVARLEEVWGIQLACRQSYGMTEMTGIVTTSDMYDDVLSVGRLLPEFKMKVVTLGGSTLLGPGEEGEIYLKSPTMMKGYRENEEATRNAIVDGWYRTGDTGYYTEKGLVYVTGRISDFIRCNGQLVNPIEVENKILSIPGVVDAGVVGTDVDGENSLTAVVIRKGTQVTEESIIKWAKNNLPPHKRLGSGVLFVDTLPKTSTGKLKRREILALVKSSRSLNG